MQTRYRAAATALLLTATAGMAAIGGAAEASGTHHAGAGAAKTLTITVKSKAGHVLTVSDNKFRPGNTIFKLRNMDGKASRGLIQLLRFRHGYTLADAKTDIDAAFGGDPAAVKRVDDGIVFYGGARAKGSPSRVVQWAVKLDKAATYYLVNFNPHHSALATMTVTGDKQDRALPQRTGFINAVTSSNASGNDFVAGKDGTAKGWMSTRNEAEEPHFVEVRQVKKGTTDSDISAMFTGGPDPSIKHGAHADTGVISPGHRFLWSYRLTAGRYAALCFWPSIDDGMPHAIMGMHTVFNLH